MKAIVQRRYGGAETLSFEHAPTPRIGERQLLVRVAAAGVDRGTFHVMRGLPYLVRFMGYGIRRPKTLVPGTNFAGHVDAVGAAVTRFRPGDEVYGTCRGAFAEYVATDEDRVAAKPAAVTFEEAAVLPYPGAVSLQAVRDRARVEPGQTVLVVGASGAVGTIAVQAAKAFDAEVTGVCGTASAELVRGVGADHIVDYTQRDFATETDRYDVILDIGGNASISRLRRALTPRGTLVIIGGEGGGRLIGGIHRQLGAQLLSPFVSQKLGTFIASERFEILESLNELIDTGRIKPVMGRTFALTDTADAIDDLDRRRTRGRLVITP